MALPPAAAANSDAGDTDQSRVYLLVIVVEAVVIAALYWLGRHFA